MARAARRPSVEDKQSVIFEPRQQTRLTRAQKTLNAALSWNQGALIGCQRPCHAVRGRMSIEGEAKQMHVLRIRIQPVYGFLNANAHLSAAKGTKRLLLERAEAAIPHECG